MTTKIEQAARAHISNILGWTVSPECFQAVCNHSASRNLFLAGAKYVLEQAREKSMPGVDCDKDFPELISDRFVRISDLEELFAEVKA